MPQLALTFLLLAGAAVAPPPGVIPEGQVSVAVVTVDPCAVARRIAERGPCLRPEDCGALEEWRRIFGSPGVLPLDPEMAAGDGAGSDRPPKVVFLRPVNGRSGFNCPAVAGR